MLFRSPRWDSVVYWALDLETGGLDAANDAIVAVGMVPVRAGRVVLRECYRTLVRPEPGSRVHPASIEAHQLVPGDVAGAPRLAEVVPEVARRLAEGALLLHHASIDLAFLRRDFRRVGARWPSPPVVDTERLLVRRARLANPTVAPDLLELGLSGARAQYGLPAHHAHDALADAVATAELFLVLRLAIGARTLRDLR